MAEYEFTIVIEKDEDGQYIAICPALQGCATAGETREEAIEMVKDAIKLNILARLDAGEPILEELESQKVTVVV